MASYIDGLMYAHCKESSETDGCSLPSSLQAPASVFAYDWIRIDRNFFFWSLGDPQEENSSRSLKHDILHCKCASDENAANDMTALQL